MPYRVLVAMIWTVVWAEICTFRFALLIQACCRTTTTLQPCLVAVMGQFSSALPNDAVATHGISHGRCERASLILVLPHAASGAGASIMPLATSHRTSPAERAKPPS